VNVIGVALPLGDQGFRNQVSAGGRIDIIFWTIVSVTASAGRGAGDGFIYLVGSLQYRATTPGISQSGSAPDGDRRLVFVSKC